MTLPPAKRAAGRCFAVALLALLAGCQEWMAEPVRVEQSYGQSVRTAYLDQIYDPARARNPEAYAPDGSIDGINVFAVQRQHQLIFKRLIVLPLSLRKLDINYVHHELR